MTAAGRIELDVSDVSRHAFTVSRLDSRGVWLDTVGVFSSEAKAKKAAEKLAHDSGLPLVIRTVHPAFG